jgi:colicin import membrane protein
MRRVLFSLGAVATFAVAAAEGDPAAAQGKLATPHDKFAAEGAAQADGVRLASLLMAQIARCWNPPVGVRDSDLVVTIRFALNEDGTLSGEPAVLNSGNTSPRLKAAAESAVRAVRNCQPLKLPAAQYWMWKDVEVRFDPQVMK